MYSLLVSPLHEAITDYFDEAITSNRAELCRLQALEECNAEHGRIEIRRCYLSISLVILLDATRWKGLKSIGMVESQRTFNGKTSLESRHDISTLESVESLPTQPDRIGV